MTERRKAGQRDPLPGRVAKPAKSRARREPYLPPLNVRVSGLRLDDDTRQRAHQRLGRQLGKFAPRIERVTARFRDINGPRGGVDKACRIKIVVSRLPSVVVEERRRTARGAFDRAAESAERAVRRTLGRQSSLRSETTRRRPRGDR